MKGVGPDSGPAVGGTTVTITGTNLAGATVVDFGSAPVTSFMSDTASQITLSSPPGTGTVNVIVVTPAGASSVSSADEFSYVAVSNPPTVTSVAPAMGPNTGGTLVTITGTSLGGATAVDFGAAKVTNFIKDTVSQIIVSSPAGVGTVAVTVLTPVGTSPTSLADQFTYVLSMGLRTMLSAVSGIGTSGGTATLMSTLTANGSPLAGKAINFTLNEGGAVTTVGTATTDANGVATLSGVSLAGFNAGTYAGDVGANFAGDQTYAANTVGGTLVVVAPPPLYIVHEKLVFQRKTNKKGKPSGKPILTSFTFEFSGPLDPASADNPANYHLDAFVTKRVKKKVERTLHPIAKFTVSYAPATDSATLKLAGKQTFPTGGQLTILGGAPGSLLGESTTFAISKGGKSIEPE